MTSVHRSGNGSFAPIELLEPRRLLAATIVADIHPNGATDHSAGPGEVHAVGGMNLFFADDGRHGPALWRTDGTPAGTRMIRPVARPGSYVASGSMVALGDAVYFLADNALWRTDGTSGGTSVVQRDGDARYFSDPRALTGFNGALYFVDRGADGAARLWRSDGTPDGLAQLLPKRKPGAAAVRSVGPSLVALGDTLLFARGGVLWRTDGTAGGTYEVHHVGVDTELYRLGDVAVFQGSAAGRTGLWRTDGTTAGTWPIKDLHAGTAGTVARQGIVHGGTLYFAAADSTHGVELWKSDGTAAGTAMLADLLPETTQHGMGARPAGFNNIFQWPVPIAGSVSSSLVSFIDLGGFSQPGPKSSSPADFNVAGAHVTFTAHTKQPDGQVHRTLYRTDGTRDGTRELAFLGDYEHASSYGQVSPSSPFGEFQRVGEHLFFSTQSRSNDRGQLYVTDGRQVRQVWAAGAGADYDYGLRGLSAVDGSLYFNSMTDGFGRELVRWDDTGGVSGFAYDDANGNGARDRSELPLVGWRVFLDRNGDGVFNRGEKFTFADESGAYSFLAFPDGEYAVRVAPGEAGWGSPAVAAPVVRGRTTWRDAAAARVTPAYGAIAGRVFYDADFDGAFDTGDGDGDGDRGFDGVRVYLDLNRNGYYTRGEPHAFADDSGRYRFDDVLPGHYRLAVVDLGPGHEYTRGLEQMLRVRPGGSSDVDFGVGYDGSNGMIQGVAFEDRDGDGKHDANEPGLAGVSVTLYEAESASQVGPMLTTDSTGYYKFPGLKRGAYTMMVGGIAETKLADGRQGTRVVLPPGRRATVPWEFRPHAQSTISGTAFIDANGDGEWQLATEARAVGWWVYADLDRDGKRDANEPARQTAANSGYALNDMFSGKYLVRFEPPEGKWTFTHGAAAVEVDLRPAEQRRLNAGASLPAVATGTIRYDLDGDIGVSADPPKSGVTVYLDLNHNGLHDPAVDLTTVTDAQGRYRFEGVAPGTYYAVPVAPSGWTVTSRIFNAVVAAGTTTEFYPMGVSDRLALRGQLFRDINRDGVATPNEGLLNYTVYLDLDEDEKLDGEEPRVQTIPGGRFMLKGLPFGEYVVRFIPRTDDPANLVAPGMITVSLPLPGPRHAQSGWVPFAANSQV